jgi:hypothetical protein
MKINKRELLKKLIQENLSPASEVEFEFLRGKQVRIEKQN